MSARGRAPRAGRTGGRGTDAWRKEYLLKRNGDSLYWQNFQLYSFGVLVSRGARRRGRARGLTRGWAQFNFLGLLFRDMYNGFADGFWLDNPLRGYNAFTWLLVLNQGLSGLTVSWLMKYADSIIKMFATSMSMFLTMALSILFFGQQPTLHRFLGLVTAVTALQIYNFKRSDVELAREAAAGRAAEAPTLPTTAPKSPR